MLLIDDTLPCASRAERAGPGSLVLLNTRRSRIATGQVAERLKHVVVDFVQAIPTGYDADKCEFTYTQCSVVSTRTGVVVDVDKFFVTFDDVYLRPNRFRMDVEMNTVPAILSGEEGGQPTWST